MDKQAIAAALAHLEAAHQIIKNALNIMTPKQKAEWAKKNEASGIVSEGTTSANERLAAIQALKDGLCHGAIADGDALRCFADHAIDIARLAECYITRLSSIFFAIKSLADKTSHAHSLADLGGEIASDWACRFVDDCSQVEKLLIAKQVSGGAK
jgi:hypothetical protein